MFSSQNSQVSQDANYIEECFATHLYTGNGSTQTITNGVDLAGEGGLVWTKARSTTYSHFLADTARGAGSLLSTNNTSAADTGGNLYSGFNANGYGVTTSYGSGTNGNGATFVSWTFRKQPKFFDVVTYTGNGTTNNITHALGSTPGCIIIKRTSGSGNWATFARDGTTSSKFTYTYFNSASGLNLTAAAGATGVPAENLGFITSTVFKANDLNGSGTVGGVDNINDTGATYVAYLFAHDAGGFGLTGTDNVISCGGYTGNNTSQSITLGYEPQWILAKPASGAGDWYLFDNMRGIATGGNEATLFANDSAAELNVVNALSLTATGFDLPSASFNNSGVSYIYIAIRRGPMKVPTDGTTVFEPSIRTGTGTTTTISSASFPPDLYINGDRTYGGSNGFFDRLRGRGILQSLNTAAENNTSPSTYDFVSWGMNGEVLGAPYNINMTGSGRSFVDWNFRRAPGFFDEVCYTGTGTAGQTFSHNLAAVPELMIVKKRSNTGYWIVYSQTLGIGNYLILNDAGGANASGLWGGVAPTASVFTLGSNANINEAGSTFVWYGFASCPGVSKCTAFTGTGALQTINCGFTSGARFVLIKRTDSTGDWYVWDSSRGLSSSNDPYLLLNSTAAEVTSTNWVDTTSTGFQVTAASGNNVNINGASYIALAIS